jgi:hypothetical protein
MKRIFKSMSGRHGAIGGLLIVVFVADVMTPLGTVEWVLYSVPLFLAIGSSHKTVPFLVAACCTVLILFGWLFSLPGIAASDSLLNRSLGIGAIAVTAFIDLNGQNGAAGRCDKSVRVERSIHRDGAVH